jgi:hypothetical protein
MKILNLILTFIWNLLKKSYPFLIKNWQYTVLVLAVLFFSIRGCVHDKIITNQAKKIADLGMSNFIAEKDRQDLEIQLKKLQFDYKVKAKQTIVLKLFCQNYSRT